MSSREQLEQVYRDWIQALNDRNLDVIAGLIASNVVHDDQKMSKEEYVQLVANTLEASSVDKIDLDMIVIDTGTRAIAARLIHRGVLQKEYLGVAATGKSVEWLEYPLTWFDTDGKVVNVKNMVDMDSLRAGTEAPRTPALQFGPPPPGFDIKAMYLRYLNAINQQKAAEELPDLALPVTTQNTKKTTLDEYRSFVESSPVSVEGFKLTLTHLITDEASQLIASRLDLTGKPVKEFMGVPPTGREMKFSEHAYYKLDGGKIAFLWALRDRDTLIKSLAGDD